MRRALVALVVAGFREAIRNRVTVVVGFFAVALILMTSVVLNLTIFSLDRVVTDFGLGVMSLLLVSLAVFMSVALLNRELERKTVFLVVSRPLSRGTFLVGRYLGLTLTLTVLLLGMSVIFGSQLLIFGVQPTGAMAASLAGIWMQLLVVSAMGVFFSSFSGAITSGTCVVGLYLVCQWTGDLITISAKAPPYLAALMRGLYWVLPNLARMDFKANAAGLIPIEPADVGQAFISAAAWSTLFLVGAVAIFRRRDFK